MGFSGSSRSLKVLSIFPLIIFFVGISLLLFAGNNLMQNPLLSFWYFCFYSSTMQLPFSLFLFSLLWLFLLGFGFWVCGNGTLQYYMTSEPQLGNIKLGVSIFLCS